MNKFQQQLKRSLQDPKFAAHFAEAQVESARELLRAGILSRLTVSVMKGNRTRHYEWKAVIR